MLISYRIDVLEYFIFAILKSEVLPNTMKMKGGPFL